MHRFFIGRITQNDTIDVSDAGQLHHMRDVLRLSVGDEVIVCDNAGNEFVCSIKSITASNIQLQINNKKSPRQMMTSLTIACAIPKKGKMDDIIDKLTQLGVDRIIPMQTTRVVALPSKSTRVKKLERWQRIAHAASQQSQRNNVPVISPITEFKMVLLDSHNVNLKLILTLSTPTRNIREVITNSALARIFLLIGPEGDFTPEEVESAKKAGFIPTSLGPRVLRVETAAVAVASYLDLALSL